MRKRLFVFMMAGLLSCTVIASPQTEVRAAVNELVIGQDLGAGLQFHQEQSYDIANPSLGCFLIVAFEVAYLPAGTDPILSEKEITLDVESPVPRMESAASRLKMCYEKVNRMKQSL